MTNKGIKSTPKYVIFSCSDFLSAYSSGKFFWIMLFNVTLKHVKHNTVIRSTRRIQCIMDLQQCTETYFYEGITHLNSHQIGYVLGLMNKTVRHIGHLLPVIRCTYQINWSQWGIKLKYTLICSPWSMDWCKQDRQKECPHGVVTGSYNSFRHSVHSKSSLRSTFRRLTLSAETVVILSKFWRQFCRRGLYHEGNVVIGSHGAAL